MAETEGAPWRDCSATDCSAVPRIEYCSHCLNRYNGFAPTTDPVGVLEVLRSGGS